jgi:arsenite methyltransferase
VSTGRPLPLADGGALRAAVRDHYTERLAGVAAAAATCCAPGVGPNVAFEAPPSSHGAPSFGCGDPLAFAGIAVGETVVDLGSGAGRDAFLAAEAVGATGRVIGVDMTPAMLERARATASELGFAQVEFREGLIEALPVGDAVADVVISNCVLNLSADVPRVLAEAARVLRPGGRLRISDTFRSGPAHPSPDRDGWCACVDGAHDPTTLIRQARLAGFVDVSVEPAGRADPGATYGGLLSGIKPVVVALDEAQAAVAAALLGAAGLPLQGWDAPGLRRWGVAGSTGWSAVVALEVHGGHGLLRSLAVEPAERRRGLGGALLAHALREARSLGLRSVAALTTTIPERLAAAGFAEVAWSELPSALHGSEELRGACPSSARAFVRELSS